MQHIELHSVRINNVTKAFHYVRRAHSYAQLGARCRDLAVDSLDRATTCLTAAFDDYEAEDMRFRDECLLSRRAERNAT